MFQSTKGRHKPCVVTNNKLVLKPFQKCSIGLKFGHFITIFMDQIYHLFHFKNCDIKNKIRKRKAYIE